MDFLISPESYLTVIRSLCCWRYLDRDCSGLSLRDICTFPRASALRSLSTNGHHSSIAVYGVGPGAVDPAGTGEGASLEPCVLGGFLRADLLEAGVGDG
jgi:hypothetical protein